MRELGHRSSPERNRGRLSSEAFCYMCTATAGHFFTSPQASPALSRLYNVSRQHQQSDREMRSEDEPWSSPLLRSSIVPHLQVFPHLSRLNLGESTGGWGGLKNGLLSVAFRCSKCPISEDIGPSSLLPPPRPSSTRRPSKAAHRPSGDFGLVARPQTHTEFARCSEVRIEGHVHRSLISVIPSFVPKPGSINEQTVYLQALTVALLPVVSPHHHLYATTLVIFVC